MLSLSAAETPSLMACFDLRLGLKMPGAVFHCYLLTQSDTFDPLSNLAYYYLISKKILKLNFPLI